MATSTAGRNTSFDAFLIRIQFRRLDWVWISEKKLHNFFFVDRSILFVFELHLIKIFLLLDVVEYQFPETCISRIIWRNLKKLQTISFPFWKSFCFLFSLSVSTILQLALFCRLQRIRRVLFFYFLFLSRFLQNKRWTERFIFLSMEYFLLLQWNSKIV